MVYMVYMGDMGYMDDFGDKGNLGKISDIGDFGDMQGNRKYIFGCQRKFKLKIGCQVHIKLHQKRLI